ncbi:MAG: DUF6263 family protein [Bacteroidales bacterium]|nr:DUF6263 family protein [Bacteroidales bacterium]
MIKSTHLLAFLVLIIPGMIVAQKPVELSYKLKEGQQYSLSIKTNQTISMEMQGQTMVLKQNSEIFQDLLVKKVDENKNFTLDITYKKVKLNQNAMGMDISYDSEKPDESGNPMAKQVGEALNKIVGSTVTTEMDRFGNAIKNNISEVMAENQSVSGIETGMLNVYPDKKIKIGDTWEVSVKPDPQSDFVIVSVYKLDEMKGKNAQISFEGVITGTEMRGQKASIQGTMSGKTQVELATGWVISSSINQEMEMEMEQEGMKMPMKLSSFIEMNSK